MGQVLHFTITKADALRLRRLFTDKKVRPSVPLTAADTVEERKEIYRSRAAEFLRKRILNTSHGLYDGVHRGARSQWAMRSNYGTTITWEQPYFEGYRDEPDSTPYHLTIRNTRLANGQRHICFHVRPHKEEMHVTESLHIQLRQNQEQGCIALFFGDNRDGAPCGRFKILKKDIYGPQWALWVEDSTHERTWEDEDGQQHVAAPKFDSHLVPPSSEGEKEDARWGRRSSRTGGERR